ncbi:MAG: hypothetical protein JNL82_04975 [Myxococcales bacterium]|nr:hypothetical protein [Myxococcales bacterium]
MKRAGAMFVCLLGLPGLVLIGCKTSASYSSGTGTTSPDQHGKPPLSTDTGGGAAPGGAAGGEPAAAGGGGAPAPCVPALADLSTSLFSGRVLIKLPKGVELVEQNPFLAVAAAPQSTTSCGGVIKYAAVGFFEWPAGTDITAVREHLMELRGIKAEQLTYSEEGTRGRHHTAAYTAAVDPKTNAPETRGWLVLRDAPNDKYAYFALFEADPAAFDGLKAVFQESGKRLLVKPRALQAADQVEAGPNGKPKAAK